MGFDQLSHYGMWVDGRIQIGEALLTFAEWLEMRSIEERGLIMRYKRRADRYVWCDAHGEIHGRTTDPYGYGVNDCSDREWRDCSDREWRKVYVDTDDREETF